MPRAGLVSVLASAVFAVGAFAQVPPPPALPAPPAPELQPKPEAASLLAGIVKDLGADDVTLRLDAQRRLVDAASLRLRDIEVAIKAPALSPEQRRRLLSAAYLRFCNEPRAGMGVQSDSDLGERGVVLRMVVPGFPAAEVLRPGDRVLSVDGQPLSDIISMRPVVIARDPGDEVPVVVNRAGNTLNLKVRLGRFSDLNQRDRFQVTPDVLDEAWTFRSASMVAALDQGNSAAIIESGLPAAAWQIVGTQDVSMDVNDGGDPNVDPHVRFDARRLQQPEVLDAVPVAAGEPRGAGSQIRWASQRGAMPNLRMAPGAEAQLIIGPNLGGPMLDPRAELERIKAVRLQALRQEQDTLRLSIGQLRAQLGPAGAARNRQIVAQIADLKRRIDELERLAQPGQVVNP